jgi:LacI family transcriptional regulator
MTVSRVINNSGYISQEKRERVEAAVAALGFVPNALARSLRFKQTKTIALIVTDITNPFFTTIARGVEDAASEQGFMVVFGNTDESQDKEVNYLNVLLQKQVDGILLVPVRSSPEPVNFLQGHNIPLVVLDRRIPGLKVDSVRCDSEQGAYLLTRHLLELGHRRIATLSGPAELMTAADRVAGYRRALHEAGLGDETAVYYGFFTPESGYEMALQALTANPRPTALLATNNFIAAGVLHALHKTGLRAPEDISVVAFDDLPNFVGGDPFFSYISQPAYEMGRKAMELLLGQINNTKDPLEPQEIILPTELILRASSAPPPLP